jgi:hypothetical protein
MKLSEKVKRGMTHCIESKACIECPYDGRDFPRCFMRIGEDALAYIRELEARVAELDKRCEANALNATIAIREREETKLRCLEQIKVYADKLAEYEKPNKPLTMDEIVAEYGRTVPQGIGCAYVVEFKEDGYVTRCIIDQMGSVVVAAWNCEAIGLLIEHDYGKTWRCWPRRPTEEGRKAAKWDV